MGWERTAEATSAASPELVWATLLDGRRWARWNDGVSWMTLEGPPERGSLLTMKPKRAPQTAFRIEAVVPGRLLALVVTIGPLAALRFRWELAPAGAGTAIVQRVTIGGPLAGVLMRRPAERIAAGMAANLARLAELAAAGHGAA